jgi:hypothetical protein
MLHVVKYSAEGQMLGEWTFDGEITDLAVGPSGQVLVAINNNHRIFLYNL